MILIAAIDDNNGMMFHKRRQSQDRVMRERILDLTSDSKLWMNGFSRQQFPDAAQIRVDEKFLDKAGSGEFCFVEDRSVASYEDRTEKILLFRWNRTYPGDLFFDIDISKGNWRMEHTEDFQGSSHKNITMEVYGR